MYQNEISGGLNRRGEDRKSGLAVCNNQHKNKKPRLTSLDADTFPNVATISMVATYISFIIWVTRQKCQLFGGFSQKD